MKNDYIKVKNHPNLVRDKNSNAILNIDLDALNQYKQERDKQLKLQQMFNNYDAMKNDLDDVKSMLQKLLLLMDKNS